MLNNQEILSILNDWNYWNKDFEDFYDRDTYTKKLEGLRNSGEVIVLTGIRRCGKSTLLKQEMKCLSKKYDKQQLLYINLEDSRFLGNLNTNLLDSIFETYKQNVNFDKDIILFLDEIQEIENWEKWIRTIYELKKAKIIYITGSSSKLLSKEPATSIAGRYLEIKVYPLTFSEFLKFKGLNTNSLMDITKNKILIKKLFDSYARFGGFPKVCLLESEFAINEELLNYFDTILLKDVALRYNLKNLDSLKKTAHFLLSNDTKLTNINAIKKALNISYEASSNYISYFKEVFLIFEVKNFSYSLKEQAKNNFKVYAIDTGIINLNSFRFSENFGYLLENIVYNYLLRSNSFEIYFNSDKNECDFILKEKTKVTSAIQVCYDINENNKKREVNGLTEAMDKFGLKEGLILTYEQEDEFIVDKKKIKVLPIWKWLLTE